MTVDPNDQNISTAHLNPLPPVQLVTTKSDAELAKELRERITEAVKPALAIMDEAVAAGLMIQFGVAPQPPLYKHGLADLKVVKVL